MDCVVPNNISLQLLEEITDDFSEHRIIGSGSCGKVYKGVYKDGKRIAVKLLYGMPGLNDEQFRNEFNYLKRLDHKNIVRMVGFCYESKEKLVSHMGKLVLAEKRYTALCLEYMKNGSLDNYISDEYSGHSWSTRYKIIKGICAGLKYLHEELKPPIYHLDLKPGNVLLDENMSPKISDFGLSKLFGEEQTQIIRNDRGTDAYSPPEYKKGGVVSMKFDIFSLGVVIMKIMAGRKGYCRSADMSSEQFIDLVHRNWRNRLQERSNGGNDMEIYSAQIKTCIGIAVQCVEYDRNKRPNIGVIVNKLNETEKNVLPKIIKVPNLFGATTRVPESTYWILASEHSKEHMSKLSLDSESSKKPVSKGILPSEGAKEHVANRIFASESLKELVLKRILALESEKELVSKRILWSKRAMEFVSKPILPSESGNVFVPEQMSAFKCDVLKFIALKRKLIMDLTGYSESADMFSQQFRHVHPDGRNRPTPAEDRRRRSRRTPAEDRTRHMKSSSASSYTLMRNWKY